ncbi:acetoin reductase [Oceanobacillus saliphilus]|uniref:acetoin reductase n=1 Tax=Oceanobacillus saliphilus TaxID=2925834 RepID=UPI00201E5374|nr:acetoin reductase [Oceanobacillus saliphilus]
MPKQKVALVTGGGSGMGAAISKRLAQDDFAVTIADLNEEAANKVANEIKENGGKARVSVTDVSARDSVLKAVNDSVEEFGDFNVIVNNAGIIMNANIDEVTPEQYQKSFDINVGGVLWGIQVAAKTFKGLGHGGKIINTTSQAGIKGNPGISVYSATKFAVRGLTQSAAQELGEYGINVNAYAPGTVATDLAKKHMKELAEKNNTTVEEIEKTFTDQIAVGKLTQPEEIANVVSFLASSDSDQITGQTIVTDGGMVFH